MPGGPPVPQKGTAWRFELSPAGMRRLSKVSGKENESRRGRRGEEISLYGRGWYSIWGIRGRLGVCRGKGHIPDIGPTTEIKSLHDMSVIDALIPPQDNGLIGIELGDPAEGSQQIIGAHDPAVHD